MSRKSASLAYHFTLELCALAALSYWGFDAGQNWPMKLALGIGLPLLAAVLWGVFRVPDDPGKAPVPVPGVVRLLLEWALFGGAALCLVGAGRPVIAALFAVAALIDYAWMADRVRWLLQRR